MSELFEFFRGLGVFGPLLLGIIDALLFAPLANDVLVVALTTRNRDLAYVYALMAAAGSVIGYFFLDVVSRKGGEAGLAKAVPPKRLERLKRYLDKYAGWAIAVACMMPPPFPATLFVAGPAAFQYPRTKLLAIVAAARVVRFGILAYLALRFGRQILRWAERPGVRGAVITLIVISLVGSAWVLWKKLRR